MPRPIVFLTDFGTRDPYAGVLELVVARHAPAARVIHLSHGVPPQRVDVASFMLARVARELPDSAVVCVVVDPGVGTDRTAVALEATLEVAQRARRLAFVGPDNGVLTELLPRLHDVRVAALEDPRYREPATSATFHGRDVFAPAAAHLALGADVASFGRPLDPGGLALLDLPRPSRTAGGWDATVRYVDRFGDLVTDLPATDLAATDLGVGSWRVHAGAVRLGDLATTFGSVAPGEGVAYVGSWGTLEVAVRDGSAAERWGLGVGDQVRVLQIEPPG